MAFIFSRYFLFHICLQLKGNNQASMLHLIKFLLCMFLFTFFDLICFVFKIQNFSFCLHKNGY